MKLMTNVKGLRKFLLKLYKDMNIQVLEMYVKTNVKSEKILEWPALPVMIITSLVSLARIEVCFAEIFGSCQGVLKQSAVIIVQLNDVFSLSHGLMGIL